MEALGKSRSMLASVRDSVAGGLGEGQGGMGRVWECGRGICVTSVPHEELCLPDHMAPGVVFTVTPGELPLPEASMGSQNRAGAEISLGKECYIADGAFLLMLTGHCPRFRIQCCREARNLIVHICPLKSSISMVFAPQIQCLRETCRLKPCTTHSCFDWAEKART